MAAILLVNDNGIQCQQLRFALQSIPDCEIVNQVESIQECLLLLNATRANIAMIRPTLPDGDGLMLAEQILRKRPQLRIILTLDGSEQADTWQRILQLGLRDVLMPPYQPQMVAQCIASAMASLAQTVGNKSASAAASENSYVVAVASARGGVGKTFVATNLAVCISEWSERVALVDFSGHPNDFTVMLDDVPRNTIADLLGSGEAIEPEFLESVLAVHPKLGLRYLGSPPQDFNIADMPKPLARDIAANIRAISEFTVIDTGPPDAPATEAAILESNTTFLVTTRDVVRLLATQKFIKQLADWDVDSARIKVLVNCAEVGAEISDSEIEGILEHGVAAYLPSNPAPATYSINSGKPLTIHDPKQPLAVVLTKLAELTFRRWSESASQQAPPERIRGQRAAAGGSRLGFG